MRPVMELLVLALVVQQNGSGFVHSSMQRVTFGRSAADHCLPLNSKLPSCITKSVS